METTEQKVGYTRSSGGDFATQEINVDAYIL